MSRIVAVCLLTLLISQDSSTRTVLLRDKRLYTGTVTDLGTQVTVKSGGRTHTFPAKDVLVIYRNDAELASLCSNRFDQAKKLYNDGYSLLHEDPRHNEKLKLAVLILQDLRDIYTALALHYDRDTSQDIRKAMQLVRMSRSDMGSERSGTAKGMKEELVDLIDPNFTFEPPEVNDLKKPFEGEIGPDLEALESQLKHKDSDERQKAAIRLATPPAPAAIPLLVSRLQIEQKDKVLQAIVYGLAQFPSDDFLPLMESWVGKLKDKKRIAYVTYALRGRTGTDTLEYFLDLYVAGGANKKMWPSIAAMFREHRGWAVKKLTSAISKNKERSKQSRIFKMLGLLRDESVSKTLVKAMKN